jgi:integrase
VTRNKDYIQTSPCDRKKPLIPESKPRTHNLNLAEIRALLNVVERTPYPFGPMLRLLLLTGLRRSEVAEARWSEFNREHGHWVIPKERMKAGEAHLVPLTPDILNVLPPRLAGDYVFSTTNGATPTNSFGVWKRQFHQQLLAELPGFRPWQIHDLRRTVATNLQRLRIDRDVREAILAHKKTGVERHYNMYEYQDQKGEALMIWSQELKKIAAPNVVPLRVT